MILINSASYVNSDLVSEFGKLPPTMLPVQNKRLYEHQVSLFETMQGYGHTIYITFPQSYKFEMSDYDKTKLKKLNVVPIYIQDNLSLGQAVVYSLNYIGKYDECLVMLHGDTLFDVVNDTLNGFSCSNDVRDNYHWDNLSENDNTIFTGYFKVNNQYQYIRKLTINNYDFIKSTIDYMNCCNGKAIYLDNWKDFGHINTYYRSISKMTTERSFNSLKVVKNSIICKSSKDINKMDAEKNWFNTIPEELQCYTPKIYNNLQTKMQKNTKQYCMEYMYVPSLASLFVFGKNPVFIWKDIINACKTYIDEEYSLSKHTVHIENCKKYNIVEQNDKMYYTKTLKRLEGTNIDLEKAWTINGKNVPSIKEILYILDKKINKNNQKYCSIVHGDFCFSNILYDFKSKSIKVIDPRGRDIDGNLSIYGDIRYDVAKLAHSILGMYDFIIADRYNYKEKSTNNIELSFENNEELQTIQKWFSQQKFAGFDFCDLDINIIMIHLFLSMIPLHSDKKGRQKAFLANALKIYSENF